MRLSHFFVLLTLPMLFLGHDANAAPRNFPQNSYQVGIDAVNDPYLEVDGTTVQMGAGVVIFGATNTTLVRNQLFPGMTVRIQFDGTGNVQRIWVLRDEEIIPTSIVDSTVDFLLRRKFSPPVNIPR